MPKPGRTLMPNPLVNNYRTADDRFVAVCMLQGQRYWPGFCEVMGRGDLIDDPRFSTDAARTANINDCIAVLDEIFAGFTLEECRARLSRQDGQWDVMQKTGELARDGDALANRFIQEVDYGDGRSIKMVSTPVQFDGRALKARPAPELGGDTDAVLADAGFDEDQIIDLKVSGAVY
jgi:crotonobetainyl-CoA:carnitine CoA-transferase CaiB-like acyl-CoA transferase